MKIPLSFKWSYLQGDKTEYQQRSVELTPKDLEVVIWLEADPKYFHHEEIKKYWEDLKVAELTGGKVPKKPETPSPVVLTVEGLKEARRFVNEALAEQHPYKESHDEDVDWDNEFSEEEEK